jgi:hypothetical protein
MQKLNQFCEYLELELPVEVRVKQKHNRKCDAYYLPKFNRVGKLRGHLIVIFTINTGRDFDTLLAHELLHAKQEEMGLTEIHGKRFREWAENMESDFKLSEIYIAKLDKN